jgi:hypothetical protein
VDSAFQITREDQSNTITIKCTKARRMPVDTFAALWTYDHEDDGETLHAARMYRTDTPDPKADKRLEIQAAIRAVLQDSQPLGKTELAEGVGHRKMDVFDALSSMKANREISTEVGARGKILCSLAGQ